LYTSDGITVPANTKQLLTHPEGHKFTEFVASSNNRLDFNVSNLAYKDKAGAMVTLPDSATQATWRPYHMSSTPALDKTNLYLVDKNTTFKLEAVVKGEKFAVMSDGAVSAKLFVVNYGSKNEMLGIEKIEDIIITPITPYVGKISDNQKIFVWNNVPYSGAEEERGTTMVPLCKVITK